MARKHLEMLTFDTLRLEGALFAPDLLEKSGQGLHTRQTEADYQLPKGLRLNDECGRAFQIARAQWKAFVQNKPRQDKDAAEITQGFVREFLRDALGYARLQAVDGLEMTGRHYPVSFLADSHVPVVAAPHDMELDDADPRFSVEGSGNRRKSAFQLAQEVVNAGPDFFWALAGNGNRLRLLRKAAVLTRPAFLEFDLETLFQEDRYPDFRALWHILHASRAGQPDTLGDICIWECWRQEGLAQGTRVRESLRYGVTQALIALGEGFLQHPANDPLRNRLGDGRLTTAAFFQELLRLVYRLIFLFTLEDRNLLHPPDSSPQAAASRQVYAEGYALKRLSIRAMRAGGFDRYADIWQAIGIVFRCLENGESRLALPALGGLFDRRQCPVLDMCHLSNAAILAAIRHLRWSGLNGALSLVDYRNMGPEELGSVYESLLELVPDIEVTSRHFGFMGMDREGAVAGNARKTSGSYYTPDSLVQHLIQSALDPLIDARIAARPDNPAEAVLSITVIDPACGSGHFLLAAARRLAERLAALQAKDGAATPENFRSALRQVIAACIYGVDRNPLALELARTALWLEGFEPGRPLSFLDHHLVCGDALLGLTDFHQLSHGIPPAAFRPLSGDHAAVCRKLTDANKSGQLLLKKRSRNQRDIFDPPDRENILNQLSAVEAMPENTPADIAAKELAWLEQFREAQNSRLACAADLFLGAFLLPKTGEDAVTTVPTSEDLIPELFGENRSAAGESRLETARQRCRKARVLHWPVVFAPIFAKGGFDCVLANPPWERIKLQEEEFFAARHPEIATAKNKAERGRRIDLLADGMLAATLDSGFSHDSLKCDAEKRLYAEFIRTRRTAEAASQYAHLKADAGGRYPLTGVGDVNTYALFAETISQIMTENGRAGFIVPTGIATDDSTKAYFADISQSGRLISLYDFENRDAIFPGVHRSYKFCLITLGKNDEARFSFFLTQPGQLTDDARSFTLSPEDFARINPNTRTCPIFRSRRDAELTRKIYRNVPVLIQETDDSSDATGEETQTGSCVNPWGISFMRMFDMSNDSHLFADTDGGEHLPLYEAKMIHQFDHRWAGYQMSDDGKLEVANVSLTDKQNPEFFVQPRYWVRTRDVLARIADVPKSVAAAYAAMDDDFLRQTLANWVDSGREHNKVFESSDDALREVMAIAGIHFADLHKLKDWRLPKIQNEARLHSPLNHDELALLRGCRDLWEAMDILMDRRSPKWLMGFRDICRATDERTVIASVISRVGVGHKLPLIMKSKETINNPLFSCFYVNISSLAFDFVARQKVGGVSLSYFILKQLPVLSPDIFTKPDIDFIVSRVLELIYTAHDLKPWAESLGYTGSPFPFDPARRVQLRAELDAYFAMLYGLDRDELRYILEPADVMGPDYPSETFRVLKHNEEREFGEYRTRRLVLAAWDALAEKGFRPG